MEVQGLGFRVPTPWNLGEALGASGSSGEFTRGTYPLEPPSLKDPKLLCLVPGHKINMPMQMN